MAKNKTFVELVLEHSRAMKGNWAESNYMLMPISEFGMQREYSKIGNLKLGGSVYELFESKIVDNSYFLGTFQTKSIKTKLGDEKETKFEVIFAITFTKYDHYKSYGEVYNVDGVAVKDFSRGIATKMYEYFVKEKKFTIIGDEEQYFGARKLWSKLSKKLDLTVDLFDIKNDEIIEKNVVLHHGNYDEDFDKRLWSYKRDKINVRSILKELK